MARVAYGVEVSAAPVAVVPTATVQVVQIFTFEVTVTVSINQVGGNK